MPDKFKDKVKNGTYSEHKTIEEVISKVDILYMTRVQRERFESVELYEKLKNTFCLNENLMKLAKRDTIIMHPMPRNAEIPVEIDKDSRAKYFTQARNGVFARMSLLIHLASDIIDFEITPDINE